MNFELDQTTPFYSLKSAKALQKNSIHILGFGFDGTTSFRPGARFAPNAIREASFGLETYSPYLDRDLDDRTIVDLGNIPMYPSKWHIMNDMFNELVGEFNFKNDNIQLLTLGGEHSISYGPIVKYLKDYPGLVLIHLDAHTDFRDGYLEEKYSHAAIIRRVYEKFDEKNSLIQYGIRSGQKEEFVFLKEKGFLKSSLSECLAAIEAIESGRPVYLTLDLDFFDPGFFPGTGTPEAGGEDFHGFMKILKVLKNKNLVGADVVELSPQIDPTQNSNCFASKVVREVLLTLNFK